MAKKVRSAGGSLKGKWGLAIGGFLLYALVVFSISFVANLVDSYGVLSSLLSLLFFRSSFCWFIDFFSRDC
jgi:hypothetical protein